MSFISMAEKPNNFYGSADQMKVSPLLVPCYSFNKPLQIGSKGLVSPPELIFRDWGEQLEKKKGSSQNKASLLVSTKTELAELVRANQTWDPKT